MIFIRVITNLASKQVTPRTCVFILLETPLSISKLELPQFLLKKLDASKVYDRLNHWFPFNKLIKCGVPLYIVKILAVWYSSQTMCVQWGKSLSAEFCVTNGVKQGGLVSPKLFNVYMDDLSS